MKRRFFVLGIIFVLLFNIFVTPIYAKEKTLGELKAEAEANRKAYNEAKAEKALKAEEKEKAINDMATVEREIKRINEELKQIASQIEEIQADIERKDAQMKDIMSYVQVTNGEANYLEYIFGATDFTDFIYRVSVAEQLGDYNEKLIEEYGNDIKKLDAKKTELNKKDEDLNKKKDELSLLQAKLSSEISDLNKSMVDKETEYKATIDMINSMSKCKMSETMSQCMNRLSRSVANSSSGVGSVKGIQISSANGTYMPISHGYVTSDFGWRSYDNSYHKGIDFSYCSGCTGPIYPVALGQVVLIQPWGTYKVNGKNCGSYIVYVLHRINNHPYVTSYWHMASVSVSQWQNVTPNTVLGQVGGDNDACAGARHLHLNLFDGNTWNGANSYTANQGRINPRTIMPQIPSKGIRFVR